MSAVKRSMMSKVNKKPMIGKFKRKNQKVDVSANKKHKLNNKTRKDLNESISSESDVSDDEKRNYSSEEEEETAQEKRLRFTKKYLEQIQIEEKEKAETEEIDKSAIAHRLREEVLEQAGKLQRKVADEYQVSSDVKILNGHKLPLTCLITSSDNKFIYSASKDCSIIKWDLESAKKIKVIKGLKKNDDVNIGHSDHVLCLAISSDNKFLASGCRNKIIQIWDPVTMDHIRTFKGHRDAISGLSFRKESHQLFSCSFDRSIKLWNLDEMAYVETLFGHQDAITSIDSLYRDRAITSGGRDTSIRIWKIIEESQLVFNGHASNIECVRLINEENFMSCGDDGVISLWGTMKKKPYVSVNTAHGIDEENKQPNWIISIAALHNTDLVASGAYDGHIRFWKCGPNFRTLTPLFTFPHQGFINALTFTSDGQHLIAATGQEHRLGRWWRNKKAKNSVVIIPLIKKPIKKKKNLKKKYAN
uniref:U3 small nucleolar RNA-interacting protein 2 n=1 Tax=Strigamia maritima TaxID=126957 RepID=T1IIB2_STRMM